MKVSRERGHGADLGSWAGNDTQQTVKTEWQGTTVGVGGTKLSEMDFAYNLQGRLARTIVTQYEEGVPQSPTVTEYKYNDSGIRVEQTEQVNGGSVTRTIYHIDPHNCQSAL